MKIQFFIACLLSITVQSVYGQWNGNPAIVNNPVSNHPSGEYTIFSVTDGSGGAIMAWTGYDYTNGTYTLFAQRKTNTGVISWSTLANPVVLFTSNVYSAVMDLIPDGAGGAYVSWISELTDTTSDIYLQRLNSSGALLFTAAGIKLNPASLHYYSNGKMCATTDGVIITWSDQVIDTLTNIPTYAQAFVQRFNNAGVPQWTAGGIQVSTAPGIRAISEIISDGSNGAIIAFSDARNSSVDVNGNFDNIDIFAQHISSSGSRLWGAADAVVSTELFNQLTMDNSQATQSIISDSAGGFIVLYEDYRSNNDSTPNLYGQRLDGSGTRLWATGGVPVAGPSTIYKNNPNLASDGANGAVATWDMYSFTSGGAIYAQRITGAGAVAWGTDGTLVTPSGNQDYFNSTMAPDGSGNYVINWSTYDFLNSLNVIRGQKLNGSGVAQWAATGANICTNPAAFARNPKIIRSSGNSMLVAWEDDRNNTTNSTDIYAARIASTGNLVSFAFTSIANGNWNNPAIWSGNTVPPPGVDVVVRHNVIANINVTCNTLKVFSPAVLTVNSGINITVLH